MHVTLYVTIHVTIGIVKNFVISYDMLKYLVWYLSRGWLVACEWPIQFLPRELQRKFFDMEQSK